MAWDAGNVLVFLQWETASAFVQLLSFPEDGFTKTEAGFGWGSGLAKDHCPLA